jgi:hypothetical protein
LAIFEVSRLRKRLILLVGWVVAGPKAAVVPTKDVFLAGNL